MNSIFIFFPLFLVLHLSWQHEHRTGNELYEHVHEHVWNEHSGKHYSQHYEHVVREHGHEPLHDWHVPRRRCNGGYGPGHDGYERSTQPEHESNDCSSAFHERSDILYEHERHEPHV